MNSESSLYFLNELHQRLKDTAEMLMWPTNTTAVGAFEFRSEEDGSLGTDTDPSTGGGGAQVKIQGAHVGAAIKAGKFCSVGHDGQDCV